MSTGGINEIWNQSVAITKSMVEIAAAMVSGKGSTIKEPSTVSMKVAECTCGKSKLSQPGALLLNTGGRTMVRLAGISGALAVGLGAYGAHSIMLDEKIGEDRKHAFRTANMYHYVGTFGLIASALARRPMVTGLLFITGTLLFSGACYIHGITGDSRVKRVAPWGGTTLILAWLSLIF